MASFPEPLPALDISSILASVALAVLTEIYRFNADNAFGATVEVELDLYEDSATLKLSSHSLIHETSISVQAANIYNLTTTFGALADMLQVIIEFHQNDLSFH